jgi:hypothetical protein
LDEAAPVNCCGKTVNESTGENKDVNTKVAIAIIIIIERGNRRAAIVVDKKSEEKGKKSKKVASPKLCH